jgi:hypothetical protein
MEGYCSTGQSPQWAAVPVEEEEEYIYILFRICNTYCFPTATMVTPTRLNVTYVPSCPVHTHYELHSVPVKLIVTQPVQRLPANGTWSFMTLFTKAYRRLPSWTIRILPNILKLSDPEDGGTTNLRNVSNYLSIDYTLYQERTDLPFEYFLHSDILFHQDPFSNFLVSTPSILVYLGFSLLLLKFCMGLPAAPCHLHCLPNKLCLYYLITLNILHRS